MKNILTEALVNSATNASFIFSYTNSAKLRMFSLSLFHIDPLIENTLILIMCMPVASNSSVYALMYGEDATLASKAIFLTSVACVVTIPIVFILHTL